MTAALITVKQKLGWREGGPALSYPIPIFHQHFDLNKTSTPLILPFYASAPAPSGFISFPTEPRPHGESLQPLSCQHLRFPRPFLCHIPPANLQLQIPPAICLLYAYTETAKHSWRESHNPADWCHCRFMFSDHSWILNTISQLLLSQLPLTFPARALLNSCPIPLNLSFWWLCPTFWEK